MDASGFHLTYCSNIHPGESWEAVSAALAAALPRVRRQLAVSGPMGIGLRLSGDAALTLEMPRHLEALLKFLESGNYYVFTINGFPYGAFHGARVKEKVYLPDWRDDARVEYTDRLARLLAKLTESRPDIEPSISTVPGAFRTASASLADAEAIAAGMLRHATALRALREQTGRTISLAIEPEPACFIETVDEAVTFFRTHLFNPKLVSRAARESGLPLEVEDVQRHIGLCLDTCHMAVEFEDPAVAFDAVRAAGVRVAKVQVTSAIHTESDAGRAALAHFANDTYLHQVVERSARGLVRYTDLPDALASNTAAYADEIRVHFHVPLFLRSLGALETTQEYVAQVLSLLKQNGACRYLEVETYTWDVLPAEYRTDETWLAIARELDWVRRQLAT
jgi:sugar phosphate isomerase/epimerase